MAAGEAATRETTLAILLGGSSWPKSPQLAASHAFACSAEDFKRYLAGNFGLPADNILDLFDSAKTAPEIVEELQSFLRARMRERPAPRDVFLYYTGHGGFINGRDYFLAVKSTIEGLEGTSSIRVSDLASALRNAALNLRRFLILDCCFAAAAFKEFQSTPGGAARLQTLDAFPRRGTTLLCSSSSRNVSIAPSGERHTMFSGALLDVLRYGDPAIDSPLSLEDVGLRVSELIRDRYDDRAVRPEVHSPDQREEDIARMPLFPNPARPAAAWRPATPRRPEPRPPERIETEPVPLDRRRLLQGGAAVLALLLIVGVAASVVKRPKPAPIHQARAGSDPGEAPPLRVPLPAPTTTTTAPPTIPVQSAHPANRSHPAVSTASGAKPTTAPPAPSPAETSPASARAAAPLTLNGQLLRFVSIPGGQFRMGCSSGDADCEDDEKPVRATLVEPFQMSATEVTQDIWQAVMDKNPSDFKGAGRPVEHVSWQDAQDFADALNQRRDGFSYRMPTEAEWEYAARAGEPAPPPLPVIAWFGLAESTARSSRRQAVGMKAANAWGLHDMLGNVAEWCEDWFSPNYQRVVRGGSWVDGAKSLRLSARGKAMPGTRDYSIGLRLVRTPTR